VEDVPATTVPYTQNIRAKKYPSSVKVPASEEYFRFGAKLTLRGTLKRRGIFEGYFFALVCFGC
jgi:hypothetical protein